MASEVMAARQEVMKASYKTDGLLCKMGDLQKQLTGLQESMNRVEILVQRLVNHQARVVEPRNIPDRAQLGKLEMAKGVDDLRQINVRSTPEGNFNFPSTGFSVVATGWDQDPLPHPTLAFPDLDSSNDRAHSSYKSLAKGPKLDSPEFDGGEPLVEAAVQKKETTMKPFTPGVCKYCGYKWFFGHKCTQYQQVNLIASEVIDGLDCAVLSMKKGEVALVTIPLEYAIGFTELRQDLAVVPTNSTFIHEVELVSFVKDKESVYALAMKDIRTLLVSGGTESVVRVWDPGIGSKKMKWQSSLLGVGGGLTFGVVSAAGRDQPEDLALKVESAFYSVGALIISDFPEPDLPEAVLTCDYIDEIRKSIPKFPEAKRRRYENIGLSIHGVLFLANEDNIARFFDSTLEHGADTKLVANWIMGDLTAYLKNEKLSIDEVKLTPLKLFELIASIKNGNIRGKISKEILDELIAKGGTVKSMMEDTDLV